jgi:hypothetical protein
MRVMRRLAFVSAVLLVVLTWPATAWAAESWVLWEIQDSLTDRRRILSKARGLYDGRVTCTEAAEARAKKWQSDIAPNFKPTPVVRSENPPGSEFDASFVRFRVLCWPVGVNP